VRRFPRIDWFELVLDVVAVFLAGLSLVFVILAIIAFEPRGARLGDPVYLLLVVAAIACGGAAWGMLKPRVVPAIRSWRVRRRQDPSRTER
jgi:hypothetical protein